MERIEQWRTMQGAELFAVIGYAGVVIAMLGLVAAVRPRIGRAGPAGVAMRILAACGILPLPAYVFHGLVVPAKDILAATTGLSESTALACSLTAFFAFSALGVRKVYRLYG